MAPATFAPHVEYATGPAAELPHDEDFDGRVEAVDLDNDGIKDLVVANYAGDSVSVLKGAGDGTFGFHADYQTGHRPTFVAVADLNGDGRSDVVAADQVAGEVSVFRGRGDCTLAAALVDHDAWDPTSVAVGDFDGDGADDVAVANAGTGAMTPSPFLALLPGDGDGSFSPGLYTATDGRPEFVVSADFNGDGKLDLAAADTSSAEQIQVLLGDGHGHFAAHVDYPMGGWPASSLAVGDFDADGDPDLAAGAFGYVRVFIGRGDGVFDIGIDVPMKFGTTGSARAYSLAVSDITGDGIQDIVTANKDVLAPVAVLVGNGDGTFVAYPHKPAVESYSAIAAGDFNGDGKQDVAVALDLDANVAILLNTGSGFTLKGHYALMAEAEALVAADFNSDGHVDVASGDTVRLGNGDGSLGVGWAYEGGGPLDIGDFNGDGHVDLATADYGADAIRVSLHAPSTEPSSSAGALAPGTSTSAPSTRTASVGRRAPCAVKIDATAPVPADNADSLWHQGGFTLNLSGSDAASGVRAHHRQLATARGLNVYGGEPLLDLRHLEARRRLRYSHGLLSRHRSRRERDLPRHAHSEDRRQAAADRERRAPGQCRRARPPEPGPDRAPHADRPGRPLRGQGDLVEPRWRDLDQGHERLGAGPERLPLRALLLGRQRRQLREREELHRAHGGEREGAAPRPAGPEGLRGVEGQPQGRDYVQRATAGSFAGEHPQTRCPCVVRSPRPRRRRLSGVGRSTVETSQA